MPIWNEVIRRTDGIWQMEMHDNKKEGSAVVDVSTGRLKEAWTR